MDDPYDDSEIGMSTTTSKAAALQPPYDSCNDDEAVESDQYDDYEYNDDDDNDNDDDNSEVGLACPFCSEDFDVVGLCCHIDLEHHREAKAAICPVCGTNVENNMAVHLITQHETILKILCKKNLRKGGSRSVLSILKELLDEQLNSPLKGSSSVASSSNAELDSLLLSFVHNSLPSQEPEITGPSSEASLLNSSSNHDTLERDVKTSALPDKDQERMQRCEFLRDLLFSTIIHDDL